MKLIKLFLFVVGAFAALHVTGASQAQDRYAEPPPLVVSPDLSAPWVMQLQRAPLEAEPNRRRPVEAGQRQGRQAVIHRRVQQRPLLPRSDAARPAQQAGITRTPSASQPGIDPTFLPRTVSYDGPHAPGTVVVNTKERFLYLVLADGTARRYGIGVGKEGFEWSGTERVTQKREWPDWRPPAEMIAREKKKGRVLPAFVKGGPRNPLGARALYLGSTLYRIHGTNAPWTIGQPVSSGCIRMRNEDVIELYERVPVGAKVVVI